MKFNPDKTVIYCDIDGVLTDCILAYRLAIWDRYRVIVHDSDITQFDAQISLFDKIKKRSAYPPRDMEEFETFMTRSCFWNPSFYRNMVPLFPMWEAIRGFIIRVLKNELMKQPRLYQMAVMFITTRHVSMYDETWNWLFRYGLVFGGEAKWSNLSLNSHKYLEIEDARKIIPSDYTILFIDDKVKNVADVARCNLPNVHCRVPARPWNDPELSEQNRNDWKVIDIHDTTVRRMNDEDIIEELDI